MNFTVGEDVFFMRNDQVRKAEILHSKSRSCPANSAERVRKLIKWKRPGVSEVLRVESTVERALGQFDREKQDGAVDRKADSIVTSFSFFFFGYKRIWGAGTAPSWLGQESADFNRAL